MERDGLPRDARSIVNYLNRGNVDEDARKVLVARLQAGAEEVAANITSPPFIDVPDSVFEMLHRMYCRSAARYLGEDFAPYITDEQRSAIIIALTVSGRDL